ncbi:MAG: hypothetical protein BYD32DRAFT_461628 [Podila humilis]|nr:MAG: hypothetical protein BYD32DRAFT_461628 [Podila humilis]
MARVRKCRLTSTPQVDPPYVPASYDAHTVNVSGPHKVIAGSRTSSVLHGREEGASKFLRDSEASYNEDEEGSRRRITNPVGGASGVRVVAAAGSGQAAAGARRVARTDGEDSREWEQLTRRVGRVGCGDDFDGIEGTDASTVAGDSGTVTVVGPPGAKGDLKDQKSLARMKSYHSL